MKAADLHQLNLIARALKGRGDAGDPVGINLSITVTDLIASQTGTGFINGLYSPLHGIGALVRPGFLCLNRRASQTQTDQRNQSQNPPKQCLPLFELRSIPIQSCRAACWSRRRLRG